MHSPAPGVPRWVRVAAQAIPFTVLPSSAWRIAVCTFHAPIARGGLSAGLTSSGLPGVPLGLYVILLSIVSELLAFTAIGLISDWGEVFPRWLPVLRGRPVPVSLAVVPAALGAGVLTLLWTWAAVSLSLGLGVDGRPLSRNAPLSFGDWRGLVAVVAYAPLLLWGPLLGGVTISYWRRRRRRRSREFRQLRACPPGYPACSGQAWQSAVLTVSFDGRVRVVTVLRSAAALLQVADSYLRTVFVLVGAALALALGIVDFTVLSLVVTAGVPAWATALIGVVLVGGPLLVGVVPAVRQVEGVAAQTLLAVEFRDGPPAAATGWPQRRRTMAWFLVHLLTGALVVGAVLGLIALAGSWWTLPAAAATLAGTLLAGRLLAYLAPVLLGPSYAERLQRLEADAARATERNRIAREIHDSVGHALSVVTVQASAARRLIGRDPAFAEDALATIEAASRRAAAELDGMLGLLRDETQRPAAVPAPGLGSLDGLLTVASSAGLTVDLTVSGDLSCLPSVVSQEAYRIVQEGLTNALKYSADGTVMLGLSLGSDALDIQLTNPASDRQPAAGGRGLRGINERATALKGATTAGAHDGLWTLSVSLPAREVHR